MSRVLAASMAFVTQQSLSGYDLEGGSPLPAASPGLSWRYKFADSKDSLSPLTRAHQSCHLS